MPGVKYKVTLASLSSLPPNDNGVDNVHKHLDFPSIGCGKIGQ